MATIWNQTSDMGSFDYNSSLWVKVFNESDPTHPFKYQYIGNIGTLLPEIIEGEWVIGGEHTGVIAEGRQIELKVEYNVNPDTGENELSSDYIYWKYIDESDEDWRILVELTGLTNLVEYANIASQYAAIAQSYADGTGGIDRGTDAEGNPIDEKTANAKYYMEQTKTLSDNATESIEQITTHLQDAESMLSSTKEEIENFSDLLTNSPWGTVGDDEIVQARGGALTLNSRLNKFPYQFDIMADLRNCLFLKPHNTAIVFGTDNIGDSNSTLFRVYENDEDPQIANDLTWVESEDPDVPSGWYMTLPNASTQASEKVTLTNGYVAYSIAVFSGIGSGGSGGGGTVGSLTCNFDQTTINSGETVTIEYYWTSPNAGQGKFYVEDNNVKIIDGESVKQGTNSFKYSPSDGTHTLKLYVIDRGNLYTNDVTLTLTVGGVTIYTNFVDGTSKNTSSIIQMRIDMTTIYTQDPITLYYTITGPSYPIGQSFEITNNQIGKSRSTVLSFNSSPKLNAGTYTVEIYAVSNGYTSNSLKRSFILAAANTIYISSGYDESTVNPEGQLIEIPYSITLLNGTVFAVYYYMRGGNIQITDSDETKEFNGIKYKLVSGPATVNVGLNYFKTTALKQHEDPYQLMIEVWDYSTGSIDPTNSKYGCLENPLNIKVGERDQSEITLSQDGLIYYFDARKGQQNSDPTKDIWENLSDSPATDTLGNQIQLTLHEFNWATNGWNITDYNNQTISGLRFDGNAYAEISDPRLFVNADTDGFTLDVLFNAYDIGADTRPLEYAFNNACTQGIWIENDTAYINTINGKNISAKFTPGTRTRITFVIDPKSSSVIDDTGLGFIKIYVNGICTAAEQFDGGMNLESAFGGRLFLNRSRSTTNKKLGFVDFYSLRIHNKAISSDAILKNHIYDIDDYDEQQAKWIKNGYSSTTPTSMPTIAFYTTLNDFNQMTKDDKVKLRIEYLPNPLDSSTKEVWPDCRVTWQGTSSIAYPVKNYKIRLRERVYSEDGSYDDKKIKYHLNNMGKKESTFCLKADYMDSSHCHNTGNANFINDSGILTNYCLTPAQCADIGLSSYVKSEGVPWNLQDAAVIEATKITPLEVRNSIYGFPCQLLIYYGQPAVDELGQPQYDEHGQPIYEYPEATFAGIYNFNLDKGCTDSFGLYREQKFPYCTSFEIAANSDTTAGAFKSIRWMTNGVDYGYTTPQVLYQLTSTGYAPIAIDSELPDSVTRYYLIKITDSQGKLGTEDRYVEVNGTWHEIPMTEEGRLYYQTYLANDFELRFPDMEEYELDGLDSSGNPYNERYFEEYESIKALVEWVDNATIEYTSNGLIDKTKSTFYTEFKKHWDLDTVMNYYLFVMFTGLIDNLGKNLMINTWGINSKGEHPFLKTENGYYRLQWFDRKNNVYRYGLSDLTTEPNEEGIEMITIYECDSEGTSNLDTLSNYNTINGKYPLDMLENEGDWEDTSVAYGWHRMIDKSDIIWYTHPYDLDSCLGCDNMGKLLYDSDIEIVPSATNGNGYINLQTKTYEQGKSPFNTYLSSMWYKFQIVFADEIKARYKELRGTILTSTLLKEYYYTHQIEQIGEKMFNDDCYAKYLDETARKVIVDGEEQSINGRQYVFMLHGSDWERLNDWMSNRLTYLDTLYEYGSYYNDNPIIARSTINGTFTLGISTYHPQYVRINWANKADVEGGATYTEENPETQALSTYISQVYYNDYRYGWADLNTLYKYDNGQYKEDPSGAYILVYESDVNRDWIRDDSGRLKQIGYELITDWTSKITAAQFNQIKRIGKTIDSNGNIVMSTVAFTSPNLTTGDQEINIYCANEIKYLTGLGDMVPKTLTLSTATKLLELEVKSTALTELKLESNTLLRKIKLSGCTGLSTSLDLKALNNLREIDLSYTQVPSIETNPNGGNLTNIYFGRRTESIDLRNQRQLNTIKIQGDTGGDSLQSLIDGFGIVNRIYLLNCPKAHFEFVPIYKNSQNQDQEYNDNNLNLAQFKEQYGPISLFRALGSLTIQNSLRKDDEGTENGLEELILALPDLTSMTIYNNSIHTLYFKSISGQQIMFPGSQYDTENTAFQIDANINKIIFEGSAGVYLPAKTDWSSYNGLKQIIFNAPIYKKDGEEASTFELILPSQTLEEFTTTSSNITFTAIKQADTGDGFEGIDLRSYASGIKMNFTGFSEIKEIIGFENIRVGPQGVNSFENYFNGCRNLVSIKNSYGETFDFNASPVITNSNAWTKYQVTSTTNMFANCQKLSWDYLRGWAQINNSKLETANNMFANCLAITSAEINWTNMNSLYNMSNLFSGCTQLRTAKIAPTGCTTLADINNMFTRCSTLEEVSFDIRHAMYPDLPNSGMRTITNMGSIFNSCTSLQTLDMSTWQLDSVTSMDNMCTQCSALNTVISPVEFNLPQIVTIANIFQGCTALTSMFSNGEKWIFGPNISSLNNFFNGCSNLITIGNMVNWDFSKVKSLNSIFKNCSSLIGPEDTSAGVLDLSHLDFSSITDMGSMFYGCSSLTSILLPTNIKEMSGNGISSMFYRCSKLKELDVSSITVTNFVTSLYQVFGQCMNLQKLTGYEKWDVSGVTQFTEMFMSNSALNSIDLSKWTPPTSGKDFSSMFANCASLVSIAGLDLFLSSGACAPVNLNSMFSGCSVLNIPNLNYWQMRFVQNLNSFFSGCNLETTKDICDNWEIGELTNIGHMFDGCTKLKEIQFNYGANKIAQAPGFILGCNQLHTLNIGQFDFSNCINTNALEYFFNGCTSLRNINLKQGTIVTNLDVSSLTGVADTFYALVEQNNTLYGILGIPYDPQRTGELTVASALPPGLVSLISGKGWTIKVVGG